MLTMSAEHKGNSLVIILVGRIDATNSKSLEQYCLEKMEQGEKTLVFDFSSVNYISSAALRVFLVVAKRLDAVKGSVKLAALSPNLRGVFDISGFSKLFTITDTVSQATQ